METDPKLTQILELADRHIKIVITVLYMFKKFGRVIEDIKKTQVIFIKLKITVFVMTNAFDGISSKLDIAEGKVCVPEDIAVGAI